MDKTQPFSMDAGEQGGVVSLIYQETGEGGVEG